MKREKEMKSGKNNALNTFDKLLRGSSIADSATFVKGMLIGPYRIALLNLRYKIAIDLEPTDPEPDTCKQSTTGRDKFLAGLGYKVIRFTENQLYHRPDHVLRVIEEAVVNYGTGTSNEKEHNEK